MWAKLVARLASPRMPFVAAAVAFALALPTIATGYVLDDCYHDQLLRGMPVPGGPRGVWDLYRFADGGPAYREALRLGWYPWWSSPELKLAFFRPIASLLRYFDFVAWGDATWGPHLESCVAYAALAFVAALAYGRLVGGAAAGLAALAYAVDDGHSMPVSWIANRYAIIAAIFGFGALLAHTRARAGEGSRALGPALMVLALLSGEVSLGILGYLVGFALFADPRGRRAGLTALAPYGVVAVAWALAYRALGYGAAGSAFYIDPMGSPLAFLAAAAWRVPALVLSGVLGPPAEVWSALSPEALPVAAVVATAVAAGVVLVVSRVASRAEGAPRGVVFALLFGAAAAVLPVVATPPDDRNFMIAGFGFFGVLALALTDVWRRRAAHGLGARVALGVLAFVHLVLAPLLLPLRGPQSLAMLARTVARGARQLPTGPRTEGKTFVMLGVPDSLIVAYMMNERLQAEGPKPALATMLSLESSGTWTAEFADEDTLVLQNPDGVLHSFFGGLYTNKPFAKGDVFDAEKQRVEVLDLTARGEPSAIRVTMHVPREQRIWFAFERHKGLVELPAPKANDKVSFAGFDLFALIRDGS